MLGTMTRSAFVLLLAATAAGAQAQCARPEKVELQHPSNQAIGAGFGMLKHPLLLTQRLHAGIDYVGPVGSDIQAVDPAPLLPKR